VQQFIGMMAVHHRADTGIYVTTSGFTQPALALGRQHRLRMIDGNELVATMRQLQPQRKQSV
jgi:restriction endonuclease Mrr